MNNDSEYKLRETAGQKIWQKSRRKKMTSLEQSLVRDSKLSIGHSPSCSNLPFTNQPQDGELWFFLDPSANGQLDFHFALSWRTFLLLPLELM